ncbi:Protein of unknown function DUF262 [Methylobacterium sp. 190mf]|uniref:DUF262 domain-containing protein n=1 Tax=Methylobacterium sp. 190mf TaxID=1761798 RepID=UPI00089E937E|nr:DUF262 domain-containing protein [Methylobacterium sp. 190mf]SEG64387.1 Protein of unknown function DUF262 [Methylobacterium sp. 190mf]
MISPLFEKTSVRGLAVLSFLDWAQSSNDALSDATSGAGTHGALVRQFGILALPPVQRSAVWRPKQVTDLWDSLLRGLPIGSFYLIARGGQTRVPVRALSPEARTQELAASGYDLLDGQQRTRAMLLGRCGPTRDHRCLWIDLSARAKHRLHMTSESQPFGYEPETGQKLSREDRRKAREAFDPHNALVTGDGTRTLYDHEIFQHVLSADTPVSRRLPRPFKASAHTLRLDELLAAWTDGRDANGVGSAALAAFAALRLPDAEPSDLALDRLHADFERLAQAEVALLRVDPAGFATSAEGAPDSLLMLFDRIGASGTPLSGDERLYSVLKYHQPRIHDAVAEIHAEVGRVIAPTKIAISALRLANALSNSKANGTPDVATFAGLMVDQTEPEVAFRRVLSSLIPVTGHAQRDAQAARLTRAFQALRGLLQYDAHTNPNGLPHVALVQLSAELWQVLLLWAVLRLDAGCSDADLASSRDELLRFTLFWRLCVYNEGRAAAWSYSLLRGRLSGEAFPAGALYARFIGVPSGEPCAYRLLPADTFERWLVGEAASVWRSVKQRFQPEGAPVGYEQLGLAWWRGARKMLPWLQRAYVAGAFPGYDPLSDRDDDLPYDLDHLCPQAHWTGDRRPVERAVAAGEQERRAMGAERYELGNAIGNLRLIAASENRSDGARPLAEKLIFLSDAPAAPELEVTMRHLGFDKADRPLWRVASGVNRHWDAARLEAFQQAVELRSARLYALLYDELGFDTWISAVAAAENDPAPDDAEDEPEAPEDITTQVM